FRLVEPPRPWFHGDHSRRATRPAAEGGPRGLGPVYVRAVPDKLYFANGNGCCTAAMRLRMMSQYSGSISIPITLRPSSMAATKVEPTPANGSRIVPPTGETKRTARRISATGFSQACFGRGT